MAGILSLRKSREALVVLPPADYDHQVQAIVPDYHDTRVQFYSTCQARFSKQHHRLENVIGSGRVNDWAGKYPRVAKLRGLGKLYPTTSFLIILLTTVYGFTTTTGRPTTIIFFLYPVVHSIW